MQKEDDVFENHLNEEYANNDLPEEFQQLENELLALNAQRSRYSIEFRDRLQKALSLLNLHIQSYQRLVITRRRRAQQRLKKRQTSMRNCFMHMLMDTQIQFLEMLPLNLNPSVLMAKIHETSQEKLKDLDATNSSKIPKNRVDFFEDIVANFTEEQWLDTFHMTKKAFSLICTRLKTILVSVNMSLESLLAMCIYAMATGSTFRSVGMLFNKPQTYVRSALYKFVQAFLRVFETNFLSMPNTNRSIAKVCEGFAKVSNLPPCVVGVLSVFELPIFAYTRPGFKPYGMDRVIVQTLIDDSLLFRKVQVSHQMPSLFLNEPNEITSMTPTIFHGSTLPHFVVAPPHYPLSSWLMQKYEQPQQQHEHDFNQALQQMNIFRDVALQRLFGRWQILSSSEFIEPESKSLIAKACCTLHNLLEECDELYSEEWSDNIDLMKYEYKVDPTLPPTERCNDPECGKTKRDTIAKLIHPSKDQEDGQGSE